MFIMLLLNVPGFIALLDRFENHLIALRLEDITPFLVVCTLG